MEKILLVQEKLKFFEVALKENGLLVEFYRLEKESNFNIGDIYLGVVKKVSKSLNSVFVDIGDEKHAFLSYNELGKNFIKFNKFINEIYTNPKNFNFDFNLYIQTIKDIKKNDIKISEILKPNDVVLVQILREKIEGKGIKLSADIKLFGKFLIVTPFDNYIKISKRIKDKETRDNLKELIIKQKVSGYGIILRTISKNVSDELIINDLKDTINKWYSIIEKIKGSKAPQRIYGEKNNLFFILNDLIDENIKEIYVNSENLKYSIEEFLKNKPFINNVSLKYYNKQKEQLFEHFGIYEEYKKSLRKTIFLKNGISLIIEKTHALNVIDINYGMKEKKGTFIQSTLDINLLAIDEIIRQIRLRNLGGIIAIDFINMPNKQVNNKILYKKFKELAQKDKMIHDILPLNKYGVMFLTRVKRYKESKLNIEDLCPLCSGENKIGDIMLLVDNIKHLIEKNKEKIKFKKVTLKVHPFIYAIFKVGFPSLLLKLCFKYKSLICLKKSFSLRLNDFEIKY